MPQFFNKLLAKSTPRTIQTEESDRILSKIDSSILDRNKQVPPVPPKQQRPLSMISDTRARAYTDMSLERAYAKPSIKGRLEFQQHQEELRLLYEQQQRMQKSEMTSPVSLSPPVTPNPILPPSLAQQKITPASSLNESLNRSRAVLTPTPPLQEPPLILHYEAPAPTQPIFPAQNEFLSLNQFLLDFGFFSHSFSDVTLILLNQKFLLHRLVLSRSPLFHQLFAQNDQKIVEIIIKDKNITLKSIELCLQWLYGKQLTFQSFPEQQSVHFGNILNLISCAYFFQLSPLIEKCLSFLSKYILASHMQRQLAKQEFPSLVVEKRYLTAEEILSLIQFIDFLDYDQLSIQMEDLLLNYLCLYGFEQLQETFIRLPSNWLERVLGADAFWCPNEFCRYQFTKQVIMQRKSNESGEMNSGFDQKKIYEDIFTHAIIYSHMTFEQLDEVKTDELTSEALLMKSLWQQTRFRTLIESLPKDLTVIDKENLQPWQSPPASNDKKKREMRELLNEPIRIGLKFSNFKNLGPDQRIYSQTFFFGGSWWSVFLQFFPAVSQQGKEMPEKWGIFLRRHEGQELTLLAKKSSKELEQSEQSSEVVIDPLTHSEIQVSSSYFMDKRKTVRVVYKLINPKIKSFEPIFESKPNDYAETQSWGYRSKDSIVTESDLKLESDSIHLVLIMKFL